MRNFKLFNLSPTAAIEFGFDRYNWIIGINGDVGFIFLHLLCFRVGLLYNRPVNRR